MCDRQLRRRAGVREELARIAGISEPDQDETTLPTAAAALLAALPSAPPRRQPRSASRRRTASPRTRWSSSSRASAAQTVALPAGSACARRPPRCGATRGRLRRAQLHRHRLGDRRRRAARPQRSRHPQRAAAAPPGGWVFKQWNFLPWEGTADRRAADLARRHRRRRRLATPGEAGRPGARGVTVAVLDTGIAYRANGQPLPPQPRLRRRPVRQGLRLRRRRPAAARRKRPRHPRRRHDRREDRQRDRPDRPRLPRQADAGAGARPPAAAASADDIAKGIRFAVAHGADVINMSFNFGCGKRGAGGRRGAALRLPTRASSRSPRSATSARRPASRRRRPARA